MDEAFSALDLFIRKQMQKQLFAIQQEYKKTIVFITHDLKEALSLGTRIAILDEGSIVQIGTPKEIFHNPVNDYVREFVNEVQDIQEIYRYVVHILYVLCRNTSFVVFGLQTY